MTREDETALVARAVAGDKAAFGALWQEHQAAVYHYIVYRVRQAETAEDLAADAWTQAWVAMPRYRPVSPFRAWLYRIAHNLVVDHFRAKHTTLAPEEAEHRASLTDFSAIEAWSAWEPGLRRLTAEQREALALRADGYSDDDGALWMRRTTTTYRGLVFRARASLRAWWADAGAA